MSYKKQPKVGKKIYLQYGYIIEETTFFCNQRSSPGPVGPVHKILLIWSGPEEPQFAGPFDHYFLPHTTPLNFTT